MQTQLSKNAKLPRIEGGFPGCQRPGTNRMPAPPTCVVNTMKMEVRKRKEESWIAGPRIFTWSDRKRMKILRVLGFRVLIIEGTRQIISGISGSFQRGKLSAIMGPSGCGKSTLLSILWVFTEISSIFHRDCRICVQWDTIRRHMTSYWSVNRCGRVPQSTGDILINGTQVKMSKLKTSMGFVPQKEVSHVTML